MVPEQLFKEVQELLAEGISVGIVEADGFANLIFLNYPIPPLYNRSSTELLVKIPMSYPNGKPDMFWTEEGLLLANSKEPKQANVIEILLGKSWRRFSWHPQTWNPASGNLRMYLEFINLGFEQAAKT